MSIHPASDVREALRDGAAVAFVVILFLVAAIAIVLLFAGCRPAPAQRPALSTHRTGTADRYVLPAGLPETIKTADDLPAGGI